MAMADTVYILGKGEEALPYGNLLSLVRDLGLRKQYSTIRRAVRKTDEPVEFTCTDDTGKAVTFIISKRIVKRSPKNLKHE